LYCHTQLKFVEAFALPCAAAEPPGPLFEFAWVLLVTPLGPEVLLEESFAAALPSVAVLLCALVLGVLPWAAEIPCPLPKEDEEVVVCEPWKFTPLIFLSKLVEPLELIAAPFCPEEALEPAAVELLPLLPAVTPLASAEPTEEDIDELEVPCEEVELESSEAAAPFPEDSAWELDADDCFPLVEVEDPEASPFPDEKDEENVVVSAFTKLIVIAIRAIRVKYE